MGFCCHPEPFGSAQDPGQGRERHMPQPEKFALADY